MNTRIYGLLWRPDERFGACHLLTVRQNNYKWTHAKNCYVESEVHTTTKINNISERVLREGAFWIGPEEMSGWEDDN